MATFIGSDVRLEVKSNDGDWQEIDHKVKIEPDRHSLSSIASLVLEFKVLPSTVLLVMKAIEGEGLNPFDYHAVMNCMSIKSSLPRGSRRRIKNEMVKEYFYGN